MRLVLLISLSIIIEIVIAVRLKHELSKYRKKKRQQNLIKQEALIKYSIEELEKDILSKNYNNLSNTTYKFIRYSQLDISDYMKELMGKGIQTTFYQIDNTPIKLDIFLTVLILIILIITRSWDRVQNDKMKLFNYTNILLDENLPDKDDLYNCVNIILKMDSPNLKREWNESFRKMMAIQEECILQEDYERLNSYLPVYELFKNGGNNLQPWLDEDYYGIIESNDDIKTKLIAYSIYDSCKEKVTNAYNYELEDKIIFSVYCDAGVYHVTFLCGRLYWKKDYSISTASENKEINIKIYEDKDKFTEYELKKDEWTFENVYNMLRQE